MMKFLILGAAICAVVLLYLQGCMVTKSIAALLFLFRPGKTCDKVSLNSCTGWVKHIGKFRESRTYEFTLNCQLSKGDAEVSLLDKEKRELLRLNQASPSGKIELDGKRKCYVRWEFHSATGKCELHWHSQ